MTPQPNDRFCYYDPRKLSPAMRIIEAAALYTAKYGLGAAYVHAHPDTLQGCPGYVNGIRVVADPAVTPNTFEIGSEQ